MNRLEIVQSVMPLGWFYGLFFSGRMVQSTDSDPRKNTPYEGNLEMFLISNVSFAGSVLFFI